MAITSGITLYKGNKSSALSKPLMGGETVTEKSVDVGRSMRRSALLLMRKRRQRDKLEAKYFRLIDRQKRKEKSRNEENKQEQTSFLSGVGSGIKQSAAKLGGNLFGAIGDLLGFLALNWISDPKNHQTLTSIVSGLKSVLKFVDWFVTGSVSNFFDGFYKMVKEDASLLERFVGFFQMAVGAIGIYYALNPLKAVKHAFKLVTTGPTKLRVLKLFFQKWKQKGLGAGLRFLFPKKAAVLKKIGEQFSKTFKIPQAKKLAGEILKKIQIKGMNFLKGNSIIKAIANKFLMFVKSGSGKGIKTALKTLTKPFRKFVDKIPIVGPFLGMVINRAFGDPWGKAAIKAMGMALGQWMGAGLGTLIFPGVGTFIGGLVGGLIGDWLGGRIYNFITKGKDGKLDPVTAEEKARFKAIRDAEREGLEGDEADAYVDRIMESWSLNNLKGEQMMLREWQGVTADQTEIDITGKGAMDVGDSAYIKIGDEVMKVIKSSLVKIYYTNNSNKNKIRYQYNTLEVVRGYGGTKVSAHNNASVVEFLGSSNPIIKNGQYISRTNDLKNGSENQILENKIGNGNGETAMIINGGDVYQNNTNINSQITSETTIEENLQVQNN